ncbi:hypothetical protein [Mariniflexile sp.]
MKKANKVIDLFSKKNGNQSNQLKYSDALNDFMEPFIKDFPEDYDVEDVFEFSINAWNFATIKEEMPADEFKKTFSQLKELGAEKAVFDKMLEQKTTKFANYNRYIIDYDIEEKENGEMKLVVLAGDLIGFLKSIEQKVQQEDQLRNQENFGENYIDRYAISLKPQQPFLDWFNSLNPDNQMAETNEASIYLVDDGIKDLEK